MAADWGFTIKVETAEWEGVVQTLSKIPLEPEEELKRRLRDCLAICMASGVLLFTDNWKTK
jgi:hypothetical protein